MATNQSPNITIMIKAARKASSKLRRDFGEIEQLQISNKGPGDFVTNADIRTEEILRDTLDQARPGYGFLMEESGETIGSEKNKRWIIDPIDGTTQLHSRHSSFCNLDRT
ncbi:MAG: inositol monophosphatase family protein [Rhodospirillales bacterium]